MAWVDDLAKIVDDTFNINWDERAGQVVPKTEDVGNSQAVKLDATFLYADLAATAKLAKVCPWGTTAKIIRAYLDCATRLIRAWGGEIRSFDGDRVMGVFIGDMKNTYASKCAREIDWTVEKVINPKANSSFRSIRDNNIRITHGIGIDYGTSRAVRAGIRNNNDLIWIGRAPSLAAKMSDIRDYPFCVYLSKNSYDVLEDSAKTPGGINIWEKAYFAFSGTTVEVYKTKYVLTP